MAHLTQQCLLGHAEPRVVSAGLVCYAGLLVCPDGVCAVCRAGAVQPGVRLPPCLQSHQWELQVGLPAAGEQVGSHLPLYQPEGTRGIIPTACFGHTHPDSPPLLHHPCCGDGSFKGPQMSLSVGVEFASLQSTAASLGEAGAGSA